MHLIPRLCYWLDSCRDDWQLRWYSSCNVKRKCSSFVMLYEINEIGIMSTWSLLDSPPPPCQKKWNDAIKFFCLKLAVIVVKINKSNVVYRAHGLYSYWQQYPSSQCSKFVLDYKFWPLWWLLLLSIREQTTPNHIQFAFHHNVNVKERARAGKGIA